MSFASLLDALKTIALHFLTENVLDMDAAGLAALADPLIPSFSVKVTPDAFIRQIIERSGVLVEQEIGRFGFAHRALQDYLSASAVVDQNKDYLLRRYAAEERWREVILIAIRLVKTQARADDLLGTLLDKSGESPASLALAGWSLAEGVTVNPDLRLKVKDRLLAGLEKAQAGGDFGLLAGALLTADPTAGRDWICAMLTGRDLHMRQRVLGMLPKLEAQAAAEFIPLLAQLLMDPKEALPLRIATAMTLATFNPELADGVVWHALLVARQPQNDLTLKTAASWAWCELGRCGELGLVRVPAGEFRLGSNKTEDHETFDKELNQHLLYLPAFYIGRTPVTVKEWRAYVQASGRKPKSIESLQGSDRHPARFVTWHESLAYAQWYGLGLPSEAEWEKAARGTDGWIYPWGDLWKPGHANTAEFSAAHTNSLLRRKANTQTTPIGQFSPQGDSPYNCVDMSGNVWEWTRSLFADYPYDPNDGREDLQSKAPRVLRGGSFINSHRGARCASRSKNLPDHLFDSIGFRIGVTPPVINGL